jgi:hypothetical protein
MGEIVNLRRARKGKKRDEAAGAAAERRARFGRSKAERVLEQAGKAKRARDLDHARLEPGGGKQ